MAAGIAYGFEDKLNEKIAVIDIGGGTFDVSILETEGNSYTTLAIDGDNKLGGDNFDEIILDLCLKKIRQTVGIDLSNYERSGLYKDDFSQAKQRLITEAERKKIELSSVDAVTIDIPNLFKNEHYDFSTEISRETFENASNILLKRIERRIDNCLSEASIAPSKIDKVILVGGTSYIPIIQNYIRELFGKNPYSDKDLSKLVAMGAAIIADDEGKVQPKDIISHSLGIELLGGRFYKILKRNEFYPVTISRVFPYPGRNPDKFVLDIYEGEDELCAKNAFYGRLNLGGIADIRSGKAKVKVTFAFDKNRELHVTAQDVKSGNQRSKTIKIAKDVKINKDL
ncbi:Chaperone protein DnaK-like domain-containing protein [Desulfonema magnum]|uniref:Chaperone protein DnaK-like domain-containing protein n=2 Tax=Desulfonema magnum TaxID=45655 RepID=A0A975BSX4_9BACT|nr:Chaperone protein DnaK-like domain-containing protein [Desulfonema magnum]